VGVAPAPPSSLSLSRLFATRNCNQKQIRFRLEYLEHFELPYLLFPHIPSFLENGVRQLFKEIAVSFYFLEAETIQANIANH
jgi:hypothetical protein